MKLYNSMLKLFALQMPIVFCSSRIKSSNAINLIESMEVMKDIEAQNFIVEKWNEDVPKDVVEEVFFNSVEEEFFDAIGDEVVKKVEVEEDIFYDAIGDEDRAGSDKFDESDKEFTDQEHSSDANSKNLQRGDRNNQESESQKEKIIQDEKTLNKQQNQGGSEEYGSFGQAKSNKNLKHSILKGLIVGVATIGFGTLTAFGGGFLLAGLASTAVGAVSGAIFGSIIGATIGYGVASGVGFGVTAFASTGAGVGAAVGAYSGFSIAVNSVKKGTQKFLKATGLEKVGKALFNFGEKVGSVLPAIDKNARFANNRMKILEKHNQSIMDVKNSRETEADNTKSLSNLDQMKQDAKSNLDISSITLDKSEDLKAQNNQEIQSLNNQKIDKSKSHQKDSTNPLDIASKVNGPKR